MAIFLFRLIGVELVKVWAVLDERVPIKALRHTRLLIDEANSPLVRRHRPPRLRFETGIAPLHAPKLAISSLSYRVGFAPDLA